MVKAVFIDFYGTLVHEDGVIAVNNLLDILGTSFFRE